MNAQQLRAAILQQAIEGKLVPQIDSEPAVEQIGEAPEDVPFAIPEKWKWCSLKELVYPTKQKIPDSNFTYIDVASINNYQVRNAKTLDAKDAPSRARKIVKEGMVLYSTVRPYLMNICIASNIKGETIASTAFATFACSEAVNNKYLFYVLISEHMNSYVKSVQKGVAYPAISDKDFYKAWIPIPPIEEQDRIVAKLEELLPLVEEYGKSQDALDKMNAEIGDKLRASILQEAIQGKLVPQLDSEPTVEQIGEAPEDVPFAIPEKWKWHSLGDVVNYGSNSQISGDEITPDTWVLDLEDIEKNSGRILTKKNGTKSSSNKNCFKKGDVLYSKLRPYLNKVVIADDDGVCTTEIVPINVEQAKVPLLAEYLQTYLMTPFFLQYANRVSYGVKMPRLGTKDARRAVIPIPPLDEQRRIVAKVEALLKEVDSIVG